MGIISKAGFLEDSTGKVWFPTYEALNYYNPETDNIDYTFMVGLMWGSHRVRL